MKADWTGVEWSSENETPPKSSSLLLLLPQDVVEEDKEPGENLTVLAGDRV
jgi:hypothetical protein